MDHSLSPTEKRSRLDGTHSTPPRVEEEGGRSWGVASGRGEEPLASIEPISKQRWAGSTEVNCKKL